MSAPASDAPKKKGKLPIILALALVLGGGGFFVMKGKGGDKAKAAIALADKETELDEFLTNTANPAIYVRTKISVRLMKDYKEETLKTGMGDVRDAVLTVLNSSPPELITDAKRRGELKKLIAEAINTALEGPVVEEAAKDEPKGGEHAAPKRTGKTKELDVDSHSNRKKNEDWDSITGPVLQVRFGALATQ